MVTLQPGDCYIHRVEGFSYMFEVKRVFNENDPQGPSVVCKHFVSIFCTNYNFELEYKENSIYFLSSNDSDLHSMDRNEFYKYVALSKTTRTTFKNLIK